MDTFGNKLPSMTPRQFEAYLQRLAAKLANPNEGFFGPASVLWQVTREPVIYLDSIRVLLMQIAHPKVAQAIADHSSYRADPIERTIHTLHAAQDLVFGDTERAIKAAVQIYAEHLRVRGRLSASMPGYPDPSYSATDPSMLCWVYATLVDALMFAYDTFLPPLSEKKWDLLYQETKHLALLFGIKAGMLPRTLAEFQKWFQATLDGDAIIVTETARDIAHAVLRTPLLVFWPINTALAVGTLPPKLREGYGLEGNSLLRVAYRVGTKAIKFTVPHVPISLRSLPAAKRAERRCSVVGSGGNNHNFGQYL